MRRIALLALLAAAAAAPGCRTQLSESRRAAVESGALMHRSLRSYHVVYSEHSGKVGYMKVYDVGEAGGPAYPWSFVYDRDWNELGFVDQYGTAFRYRAYTDVERDVHGTGVRVVEMPADSLERNVMRMLGIDPALDAVSFPEASRTDVLGG